MEDFDRLPRRDIVRGDHLADLAVQSGLHADEAGQHVTDSVVANDRRARPDPGTKLTFGSYNATTASRSLALRWRSNRRGQSSGACGVIISALRCCQLPLGFEEHYGFDPGGRELSDLIPWFKTILPGHRVPA
jgi:hypothetical protein